MASTPRQKAMKAPNVTTAQLKKAEKLPAEKLGAWFEDVLKDHFNHLKATHQIYWHRFPDSKTAGNFIADQPSDFLVKSTNAGAMLVEAKASARHNSLRGCLSSNVSSGQALHHKLWNDAGQPCDRPPSLFIFCGVSMPIVQIWDGGYVAECRMNGKVMDPRAGVVSAGGVANGGLLRVLKTVLIGEL